jgi:ribosomal protein L37E
MTSDQRPETTRLPVKCRRCSEYATSYGACNHCGFINDPDPRVEQRSNEAQLQGRVVALEAQYATAKECLQQAAADRDMWEKGYREWMKIATDARARVVELEASHRGESARDRGYDAGVRDGLEAAAQLCDLHVEWASDPGRMPPEYRAGSVGAASGIAREIREMKTGEPSPCASTPPTKERNDVGMGERAPGTVHDPGPPGGSDGLPGRGGGGDDPLGTSLAKARTGGPSPVLHEEISETARGTRGRREPVGEQPASSNQAATESTLSGSSAGTDAENTGASPRTGADRFPPCKHGRAWKDGCNTCLNDAAEKGEATFRLAEQAPPSSGLAEAKGQGLLDYLAGDFHKGRFPTGMQAVLKYAEMIRHEAKADELAAMVGLLRTHIEAEASARRPQRAEALSEVLLLVSRRMGDRSTQAVVQEKKR